MSDIFKDMQANVGCDYISNLPSYKRKVWHEMKRLPLTNYDIKQLEDFSKYVFGMSYQSLKDVMKQQKGREEQCRKQGCWWKREEQLAKKQYPRRRAIMSPSMQCMATLTMHRPA